MKFKLFKINLSLTSMLLSITICSYGQPIETRIKEIRKMYAEVGKLSSITGNNSCKTGSKGRASDIDFEGTKKYRKATQCYYTNGYTKLTSKAQGWEWNSTTEYFFKNNKLFFAYAVHSDECDISEYRYYFDTNGNLIQLLAKEGKCSDDTPKQNMEIKNSKRRMELFDLMNEDRKEGLALIRQ